MTAKLTAVASLNLSDLEIPAELENQLRRADLFTTGVVACCHDLLKGQTLDGEQAGLFISTAYGPMQCNLDVLDALVAEEPLSPTLFAHSVFNTASGYASRIFGIHGPAVTQTSFSYPFFTALAQAKFALEQAQLTHAIVVQAETYSTLLEDGKDGTAAPWPPGAVAWLLGPKGLELQHIQVNETPCPPLSRLHYQATSSTGTQHHHPLSMGLELNHLFTTTTLPTRYNIDSGFGTVHLQFGDPT